MSDHMTSLFARPTTAFDHCPRTNGGKGLIVARARTIDEFCSECLPIYVYSKPSSGNEIDVLSNQFILLVIPSIIRSDIGHDFVAQALQDWNKAAGQESPDIGPASTWENGHCESSIDLFRDEFLN